MKYIGSFYLVLTAITVSSCASTPPEITVAHEPYTVPIATPRGVTLEPLGKAQGYDLSALTAAALARDEFVYANEKGLTLYTWDQDPIGKSLCTGECTSTFKPFLASSEATPDVENIYGQWSTVLRDDGTRQWALNGKALYSYVNDVDPGSVGGDSPAAVGAPRLNGAGKPVGGGNRGDFQGGPPKIEPMPAGWSAAKFYPFNDVKIPPGFSVKEVPDAAAFALVDARSHTVYAFSGDTPAAAENCGASCDKWVPLAAPQLAKAMGDFAFRARTDGIRQWTYNGQPLYTHADDMAPGYANGVGTDDRWTVAAVARYFMPSVVSVQSTPGLGRVLATAEGLTLYRRDGHILQSGGGHSLRRGQPARPAVGRDLGTNPRCLNKCDEWRPFLAGADASPHGFWNIETRADGQKQWTYQGYALWTYGGDAKPGDMNGHDTYTVYLAQDSNTMVDVGTPMDGSAALYWAIALP